RKLPELQAPWLEWPWADGAGRRPGRLRETPAGARAWPLVCCRLASGRHREPCQAKLGARRPIRERKCGCTANERRADRRDLRNAKIGGLTLKLSRIAARSWQHGKLFLPC